jgi:hypothetical protein
MGMVCTVEHCVTTKAFDHKMINLSINRVSVKKDRSIIKDQIINNPVVRYRVRIVVAECHLQHSDPSVFPPYQKRQLLEQIGLIQHKLNMVNRIKPVPLTTTEITSVLSEVEDMLETFPDPEFFEQITKSCEDDIFFEILTMTVKNGVLAEQKSIFDKKNASKSKLRLRLLELKKDYVTNSTEIFRLESKLYSLVESEIREEVANMNIFDRLTSEKMTPHFLNLAKGGKKTESTAELKKPGGSNFENITENRNFVTEFYENLYKNR